MQWARIAILRARPGAAGKTGRACSDSARAGWARAPGPDAPWPPLRPWPAMGAPAPPIPATVEVGHVKRFTEAIGDHDPRWLKEAPPTFLVALAPPSMHLAEAEEYGKGWLNGGNRFEYLEPVKVGDRITATGRVADVYEKTGSRRASSCILFGTGL